MEITADMRDEFFEKNGYMGCDDVVEAWHKREIEKDSEPEAKPQCDGKFNGGYIGEAKGNREIYDLLVANTSLDTKGISPNSETGWFYIWNNKVQFTEYWHLLKKDFKQFYINNGALSWGNLTISKMEKVETNSIEDLNELPIVGEEDGIFNTCGAVPMASANNNDLGTLSIKDDNGKEYKFEKPEFECELKFIFKNILVAIIEKSHIVQYNKSNGLAYIQQLEAEEYNLTPIKPKWYEDESNYPAIVINTDNDRIRMVHCPDDWALAESSNYRLAKKEEVNSLYYQDKE